MRTVRSLVLLVFIVLSGSLAYAGAPPPPSTSGDPGCWPPPCVPVDGGISLLIAAGAAYGAKKFYDKRKKSDSAA